MHGCSWQQTGKAWPNTCWKFDAYNGLMNLAGTGHYAPRANWRPITKFENRGIKLGHQVWDLCYWVKPGQD